MSRAVRLQLMISCEDLPRVSVMRKKSPNAVAIVARLTEIGSVLGIQRHRIGVTEIISQTCNPEFCKIIFIPHTLGTEQKIAVDIFHSKLRDSAEGPSIEHDTIVHWDMPRADHLEALGSSVFDVEAILTQRDASLCDGLAMGGKVHVRIEVSSNEDHQGRFRFHLRGLNLPNTRRNFLDWPNFYLEIHRKQKGNSQDMWHPIYRTKQSTETLNPCWDKDTLDLDVFCNNDLHRELRLMIFDCDGNTRRLLGWVDTTPETLLDKRAIHGNADDSRALLLTKGTDSHVISTKLGKLIVLEAQVLHRDHAVAVADAYCSPKMNSTTMMPQAIAVEVMAPPPASYSEPSSFDAIEERCSVELIVALDFTKKNGDFATPGTSHHRGPSLNNYQWVMTTLGAAVGFYSKSHEVPVHGFGGQYQLREHEIFQCGSQAKAKGVTGLMEAYDNVFSTGIVFGDRCKYDSVIMAAAYQAQKQLEFAQQQQQHQSKLVYTVLLVLTTGTDSDVLAAKEKLALASASPLSVLFLRIDNRENAMFSDVKIRTYLQSRQHRLSCHCIDTTPFATSRDSRTLSAICIDKIKADALLYFESRGLL